MLAGTCKHISISGEISVAAGNGNSVSMGFIALQMVSCDPNEIQSLNLLCPIIDIFLHYFRRYLKVRWLRLLSVFNWLELRMIQTCIYLRPVWLCTWSGNQGEGQGPSGRYSSPLTRKKKQRYCWCGMVQPSPCNQAKRIIQYCTSVKNWP